MDGRFSRIGERIRPSEDVLSTCDLGMARRSLHRPVGPRTVGPDVLRARKDALREKDIAFEMEAYRPSGTSGPTHRGADPSAVLPALLREGEKVAASVLARRKWASPGRVRVDSRGRNSRAGTLGSTRAAARFYRFSRFTMSQSAFAMIRTSSSKVTLGFQPSSRSAFEASPRSCSTSAGRKYFG